MKLVFPCLSLGLALPGLTICPDGLESALLSHWAEPSARLGVVVRTKEQVLVDINGDQAFIPASLQKLFTTAQALNSLGGDFRIATVLTASHQGELKLALGGDPGFSSDRDLPRLVAQLQRGRIPIKTIEIVPEPWGKSYGRGWEWEDLQEPYGAPIGVVIDENILEWKLSPQFSWKHPHRATGWQVKNQTQWGEKDTLQIQAQGKTLTLKGTVPTPIEYAHPIPDPEEQVLMLLRRELQQQKIKTIAPGQATIFSMPLKELVKITNKNSHNLYAEQLFRLLGKNAPNYNQDYEAKGREIITKEVKSTGFYAADGSGLSRYNQATPKQVVDLLLKMENHPDFRASLPSQDGTLTNRLKGLQIQAKTGTLTGVSTLAGYLNPPRHPPVTFAILINHSLATPSQNRATIDAMVSEINRLTLCGQGYGQP